MSLRIIPVLCRAGQMDNYSYILVDEKTGQSAVIDPSETQPIIEACEKNQLKPNYILNTHHHYDHTDANAEIKKQYNVQVIGAQADKHRIPALDIGLANDSSFLLGESQAEIIAAPGHTNGHILWYFPKDKALFTGDTLFNLCIGGLFEGTPEEMYQTLQKIKNLPDDTLFYPGHEYTLHCLQNAVAYNQNKPEMQEYLMLIQQRMNQGLPIAPISLRLEKACNPYLQANSLNNFARLLGY